MNLECPLPQTEFDVITMGHGSGGLLTHKLLKAGVFNLFDNEILRQHHDGATLDLNGKTVFTTDSFVVSPLFFPGGNIGDLAINGTINDLAMCGGLPNYISVAFILEEGLEMTTFWEVLVSMKRAAELAGVKIVTGDTKVVERGKGDQIFINTTGIGALHPKAKIGMDRINRGDKIILSGEMAHHGTTIMSLREGLKFDAEILTDTCSLHEPVVKVLDQFGSGIRLFRDPTRGGVATTLAEIAGESQLGVDVYEDQLPQNELVNSACELLGLDPLYVANEGLFLSVVDSQVADRFLQTVKSHQLCRKAALIGEITDQHGGKVVLHNAIGGKRVLGMLPGEQLPRIC